MYFVTAEKESNFKAAMILYFIKAEKENNVKADFMFCYSRKR